MSKITKNIISFYIFRKKERVNDEKILILQFQNQNTIEYKQSYIWQKN